MLPRVAFLKQYLQFLNFRRGLVESINRLRKLIVHKGMNLAKLSLRGAGRLDQRTLNLGNFRRRQSGHRWGADNWHDAVGTVYHRPVERTD